MKLLYDLALYLHTLYLYIHIHIHSTSIPTFDGPLPSLSHIDRIQAESNDPSSIRSSLQPLTTSTLSSPSSSCRFCGSLFLRLHLFATRSVIGARFWRISHKPQRFGRIIRPLPYSISRQEKLAAKDGRPRALATETFRSLD